MLHTRMAVDDSAGSALWEELEQAWAFYYPLASPYVRLRVGPRQSLRLEQEISTVSDHDAVLWAMNEDEAAAILAKLEIDLTPSQLATRSRSRARGYYDAELMDCRRPLLAVRLGDLHHLVPRVQRTEERPRLFHEDGRGYVLRRYDGSEIHIGHSVKL